MAVADVCVRLFVDREVTGVCGPIDNNFIVHSLNLKMIRNVTLGTVACTAFVAITIPHEFMQKFHFAWHATTHNTFLKPCRYLQQFYLYVCYA